MADVGETVEAGGALETEVAVAVGSVVDAEATVAAGDLAVAVLVVS